MLSKVVIFASASLIILFLFLNYLISSSDEKTSKAFYDSRLIEGLPLLNRDTIKAIYKVNPERLCFNKYGKDTPVRPFICTDDGKIILFNVSYEDYVWLLHNKNRLKETTDKNINSTYLKQSRRKHKKELNTIYKEENGIDKTSDMKLVENLAGIIDCVQSDIDRLKIVSEIEINQARKITEEIKNRLEENK